MQRSFKVIVTYLIGFTSTMSVLAQDDVKFKDVLLDGRPAKLNVVTGEVTLLKMKVQDIETERDSVKTNPILNTNKEILNSSNESKVSTDANSDFYFVKEGDNLFKIAVKFKTSLTELKEANNLETTLIKVGQKLRIRNFHEIEAYPSFWIVKKGDNLYRIAIENGTTVDSIKQINGLADDVIKIGQKLKLN